MPHDVKSIEEHRRFYAEFIVRSAGFNDQRLIDAFASVAREHFLGPGPWPVFVGSGYIPTVDDDPRSIYHDVLVGLATDRKINNGQPSLHAGCIASAAPKLGDHVIHVGAGTGYYTAILSTLVGPEGHVLALEIEPDVAARAGTNLAGSPNVQVELGSANHRELPPCDLIYASAGATHPPGQWLDALRVGGRLVVPLTPNEGFGVMLMVTRRTQIAYEARALMRASFIPCIGARDDAASASLTRALERQSLQEVRSLCRDRQPDGSTWCVGEDWWLSTSPAL